MRVRSWTPLEGQYHGFLITHGEAISISDYFTVRRHDKVVYRPTCHYAYHPCDDTVLSVHELAGRGWVGQEQRRILMDEIYEGVDELGALLMGHKRGAYWYGSRISVEEARKLAPFNNATSIQVAAGVMGGVVWAMENPHAGISIPTMSILSGCWSWRTRISGKSWASTATGLRSSAATTRFRKMSICPTHGSSRISG